MNVPFILLADDEASFVETMAKRLDKRDLKVITALGGEEAIEFLDRNRNVDVVILDVKMPGMDGIECLREIKKKYPLVEVIMLTGHATVETAIEGMKLGAFDYLMKPCEIENLVEKVNQAARKKQEHMEKIKEAQIREALSSHGLE
ncbi:MAG: response regulator [Deltaproteobacteria bacterium]|nr:response regulator [Deltaproteobacteria bacterium]MBW2064809.1 response regulator [Deltaproteobacteria bacterium]